MSREESAIINIFFVQDFSGKLVEFGGQQLVGSFACVMIND